MNEAIWLLATGNAHKVQEIREIFSELWPEAPIHWRCATDYPQHPEPVEDGQTFEANAIIKAKYYAEKTGLPSLADDSGLVIDALDGRPGIHSARYADTPAGRIERVLSELKEIPQKERSAHFACVTAFCTPKGEVITASGRVDGRITAQVHGEGGFGYDPIFALTEGSLAGQTLAEIPSDAKNELSHRGRALRILVEKLKANATD